MARPLRLELPGGLYHVTARGDGREDIYLGDADREAWLEVLGQVCRRFNWVSHAWCQMSNHYHLLLETPRTQRRAVTQLLADFEKRYGRKEAMARAYLSGQHTMAAIARHFGVHYSTVSRMVRAHEESMAD